MIPFDQLFLRQIALNSKVNDEALTIYSDALNW